LQFLIAFDARRARRERPGPRAAILALALATFAAAAVDARAASPGTEQPPASSGGLEKLDLLLHRLESNRRLLIIAAHPDDEDSTLLALVSRGMGGEAAYLSLTRGDGGQNLIGEELGVGLGLIRTEELNSARRLDGARQFFTRAYDFGFSKSAEETFRFWPKQALLEDAVRIIRRFRPQVVVAIFSGTPRDGHGQHQASGIVAREAFRLAGDPAAFPELQRDEGLTPWTPSALYQTTRFLDRDKTTIILPAGDPEALTGRSYRQIGVASRSLQRSQSTGALQPIGPSEARLGWLEGGAGRESKDPFDGIDTSLAGLAAGAADPTGRRTMGEALRRAETLARETRAKTTAAGLSSGVGPLATILSDLRAARAVPVSASPAGAAARAILDEKISVAEAALACAAGVAVDALAESETAIPGETLPVAIQVFNGGTEKVEVEAAALVSSGGFKPPPPEPGKPVPAGTLAEWKIAAAVPADALPSIPYFLRQPLSGGMYDWSAAPPAVRGEPFAPRPLQASVELSIAGTRVRLTKEATFRFAEEAFGEVRHAVRVVPAVEVFVTPELLIWSTARKNPPSRVSVELVSNSRQPVSGEVVSKETDGWKAAPVPFSLGKKGERAILDLALTPARSPRAGRLELAIEARTANGARYGEGIRMIDYEHIRPVPYPRPAAVALSVLDLKLPPVQSVGYVRGASDRVPEALAAIGLPVHVLTAAELERGDLARFDAIVIGARAYEIEPALERANARLLEYARNGGLVIVQYQQPVSSQKGWAPEKLEIQRDRVTDENAAVRILDANHPIFTTPNRIGPSDWEGWVQERGIYFAHSWAPAYEPLLAMADPGEAELKGALLAATIGKGRYVYTGLAFFRELPAGVPGAYRLFANLLAWKAR
jgi:LmbE family N-acetylglucosaminyl deacetylase